MELIKSEILGCEIVICNKRELIKAKKKYPDKVIYLHGEIAELKGLTPDEMRTIHVTKEVLGGHLLFEDNEDDEKPLTLKEKRRKK